MSANNLLSAMMPAHEELVRNLVLKHATKTGRAALRRRPNLAPGNVRAEEHLRPTEWVCLWRGKHPILFHSTEFGTHWFEIVDLERATVFPSKANAWEAANARRIAWADYKVLPLPLPCPENLRTR